MSPPRGQQGLPRGGNAELGIAGWVGAYQAEQSGKSIPGRGKTTGESRRRLECLSETLPGVSLLAPARPTRAPEAWIPMRASFLQWKHFYQEAPAGSVHRILSKMEDWPGGHGQSNLPAFVRIQVLCSGEEVQPALMMLGAW